MNAAAPDLPSETPPAPPLLPPFFENPRAILWLWALPAALLLLLNLQAYELIEGNMDAAQRHHALLFGLAGVGNLLGALGFHAYSRFRPQPTAPGFGSHLRRGLVPLVVQVAYLWLALNWSGELIPSSVTLWIYPTERFTFNQFTFAMLPLFLGILRIACAPAPAGSRIGLALGLGLGLGAPITLYVLVTVIAEVYVLAPLAGLLLSIGFVTLGILMFVGIVRATMFALRGAEHWGPTGERVAIAIGALGLPLGGLLLNRSIPFPVDFQAWEVYALTLANAAFLFFASAQHARRPQLSLLLLCGTFPFSLYFFFVFLPYTPLSILAVIAFGLGFLVLTPTFLFVLHLNLLNKARRALAESTRPGRLRLAGLACALILPGFFVVRSLADRAALHTALDYVYAPVIDTHDRHYPGNRLNLRRALASHRSYKNGIYYPILSDFYAWLVFDHLVLPDDKLATLETTFFGAAGSNANLDPVQSRNPFGHVRSNRTRHRAPRPANLPRTVAVSALEIRTAPSAPQTTTATLVLTLAHSAPDSAQPAEYVQSLPLPAGVFVNGFRLHIDGTPVPGRIVEKKTALWVYNMIRDTERRDPGLLVYTGPDELELRVFPINARQPVTVEIDFLVPTNLAAPDLGAPINAPEVVLGRIGELLRPQLARGERGTVATGLDALQLPGVDREPYVHVIVDRSADNAFTGDLAAAVRTLRATVPAARRARVTLANHDSVDLLPDLTPFDRVPELVTNEWAQRLPTAGSLSLDISLARALRRHREADLDTRSGSVPPRPVFVILSRTAGTRPLALPLAAAWSEAGATMDLREIGADGTSFVHRENVLDPVPLVRYGTSVRPLPANRAVRFAPATGSLPLEFYDSASAAWLPVVEPIAPMPEGPWTEAVALQLRQQDHTRSPGTPGDDLPSLIAASRAGGILIPDTSYIVVENSAQWKMLEKGEQQKLGQNAALEFVETPAPPALWVALGFAAWLVLRRRCARARA